MRKWRWMDNLVETHCSSVNVDEWMRKIRRCKSINKLFLRASCCHIFVCLYNNWHYQDPSEGSSSSPPLMLLRRSLCVFVAIQLQFLGINFNFTLLFVFTYRDLLEIPILEISETRSLDFHSNSNVWHEIYNFHETPCLESYGKYEVPCVVYCKSEFLGLVLLSHGECMISRNFVSELLDLVQPSQQICTMSRNFDSEFLELIQPSHHMCMISRNFDSEFLELVQSSHHICMISGNFESEFLELVQSSHHTCMISGNFESKFLELVKSSHHICTISRYFDIFFWELALSSYDICLTFGNFAPSSYYMCISFLEVFSLSYNICPICKYSQTWLQTSDEMYCENAFIDLVIFSYNKCTACETIFIDLVLFSYNNCTACETTLKWNKSCNMEYCADSFFEPVSSLNEYCVVTKGSRNELKIWKFKRNNNLHPQVFYYFMSCLISLAVYKCNFFLFSFWEENNHAFWRVGQFLRYVSLFLYGHCISRGQRGVKMAIEDDLNNGSDMAGYIERNNYFKCHFLGGGRHQTAVNGEIVYEFLEKCTDAKVLNDHKYFEGKQFEFKRYGPLNAMSNDILEQTVPLFFSKIPLDKLSIYLNVKELREMSVLHMIPMPSKAEKKEMVGYFSGHHCNRCELYASVLVEKKGIVRTRKKEKEMKTENRDLLSKFPPDPPSRDLIESIISGFCNDTTPQKLIERGCAVCGRLSPIESMDLLNEINCDLDVISPGDVGRYERLVESDPIMPLKGPILAEDCDHVCRTCQLFLKKKKMPPECLANSFWIGSIPSVLQSLTFAEKMLISKIRHNKCLVRVSSGRAKMTANVIMFSNPTVKVYHALPPSRREISEILAFVFRGPIQPTECDIKRTPMLVRRNIVKEALEWLKLNHVDYADLQISLDNLSDYPLEGVPVNIEYSKSDPDSGNKIVSAMSVYDDEFEDGTTDGPCPFTVHGLTGPEFENMSIDRLKARALQHLAENGSTLGISHDSKPQSMYDNPQVYPQMFPWLFPYGFGGIGQKCHFGKISEATQKSNLLMYHDKRFQTDFYFPMIAFNHEQLKAGVTGSFLLAKRKMWPDISNRLKSLNRDVLKNISDKLLEGAHFSPTTVEEKKCFQLLNDLDHVGGFVKGSITSKKHMRNEIWSMISHLGAPSWFITLSPADNRHPICLYYAGKDVEFKPELRSANERNLLVSQNPVAASRFFDLMVRMFIKHVLGIGTDHSGLYGNTAGYYGTVEQQGRLTLHLHTILWIENALSPQEIRDKLMNNDCEFQQSLVQYLEGCQKGEFITGSMEHVKSRIPIDVENRSKGIHTILQKDAPQFFNKSYQDPTVTLPEEPPDSCQSNKCTNHCAHQLSNDWWSKFCGTVDDILLRSNVHKCSSSNPEKSKFKAKGCLNRDGICKARFPRPVVPETTVNIEDGYINLKKMESMLNTITPCVTYLFRCNTDVTSLLSGTSIKAVISYVTDYIAKPTLKTYQIFATAYNVFERNANLELDDDARTDDARKLILKIVNALSSKMEIGSPMASMYLLKKPDHYTSHEFIPFWWKSFVNHVTKSETSDSSMSQNHDVDIKMEDVFQEEKTSISESSNDKKFDDHDIDVEIEVTSREEESKEFQLQVVDDDEDSGLESHLYDVDPPEFDVETSPPVDMAMDIDDPSTFLGGGPGISHSDVKSNSRSIFQDLNRDQDQEDAGDNDGGDEDDLTDDKLLITQDGSEYVASSKVDDYKYRPEAYNSSSLYNWSRLSVKVKISRNGKDNTYFRFLSGHGQRNSHMVKLVPPRADMFVLNFIGGPLPRCDQGDFEYYCRTMLTIFKPWRSSSDLKETHKTWSDAFKSYKFEIVDRKIMNNFNLRYECLDERDDYHAILKRQSRSKEQKTPSSFPDQYDNDFNLGMDPYFEENYGDQQLLGPNAIKRAQQMFETELMLNKAGWFDDGEKTDLISNIRKFQPPVYKTGLQWKSVVKQCRDYLLKVKKKNYSPAEIVSHTAEKFPVPPLDVKILPAEYFMHNFQAEKIKDREIISNTIGKFSLNKEQKRAFHIIANHASEACPDQLKMYLGGMGGTGKTQVIKALMSMFDQRHENHRFIVLAPTGTAAALLNGSTYHSILGVRSSNNGNKEESLKNENTIIREIQERLEGVDYIFFDELSMIACHELYAISSQLSKVTNEHNKPFGGKNVILAGDFAQLPPTNGFPLYSNTVQIIQDNSMSKRNQESAIGKILWHQITTVVILTQNMRQTEMSEDDKKFRTALSNMRYALCTEDDLEFLDTLSLNGCKGNKSLSDFKNVSIITSLNTQKDQINESCSIRFAQDTGQQLTHFFSIDMLGNVDLERKKRGSRAPKKISAFVDIPDNIQKTLWDSSAHTSEHFPGKLSLCVGMPIMIRNNDATELCITKGQEAYVVGWDAINGPKGQNILETLYLELKNPPKDIQIPNLPRNVIPMSKMSKKIKCNLPNDRDIIIVRQQINVLPNFSMTDYASQGKSRLKNPVKLSHCRNFQSIYTCLSRGVNAAGTLIIQGFDRNKITKGLPGHLRQEFRELHLLDNITKEIYEGQLNKNYFGPLRNPMIYKYQNEIKKKHFNNMHQALMPSDSECIIKDKGDDGTWNMNVYKDLTLLNGDKNKRKRKISDSRISEKNLKKIKLHLSSSRNWNTQSPLGLTWDETDYSCAYDSLFTVLHHIWNEGQAKHRAYFENGTQWIQMLNSNFTSLLNQNCTFESIRDFIRSKLNHEKPSQYCYGKNYTDIDGLVREFTFEHSHMASHLHCRNCKITIEGRCSYLSDYTAVGWSSSERAILHDAASIQIYLDYKVIKKDEVTNRICLECRNVVKKDFPLYKTQYITELPTVLIFALAPWIDINQNLRFHVSNSIKEYILKGIIYSNGNHFTARLVDESLTVWYHDGQTTRSLCQREDFLMQTDGVVSLKTNGQYEAILAFYVEK